MNDVIIIGELSHTAAQTILLICRELSIPVSVKKPETAPDSPEHRRRNPFSAGPSFEHEGVSLFDPVAMALYLDDLVPDHHLKPVSVRDEALMIQWMSVCATHLTKDIITDYLTNPAIGNVGSGGIITRGDNDGRALYDLGILNAALARTGYLAGDQASMADLFLYPIIAQVCRATKGDHLVTSWPELRHWRLSLAARESTRSMHGEMNCSPAVYPKVG